MICHGMTLRQTWSPKPIAKRIQGSGQREVPGGGFGVLEIQGFWAEDSRFKSRGLGLMLQSVAVWG